MEINTNINILSIQDVLLTGNHQLLIIQLIHLCKTHRRFTFIMICNTIIWINCLQEEVVRLCSRYQKVFTSDVNIIVK